MSSALATGDFVKAEQILGAAALQGSPDEEWLGTVAYYKATLHAYQHDWASAIKTLTDYIAQESPQAKGPTAFYFHNAVMMLRQAQGDLTSAIAELDRMHAAGQKAAAKNDELRTTVQLKELWHRAYLLRMLAESRDGARREELLEDAKRARGSYEALAAPLDGYADSIAVLNGFFAVRSGDREKALVEGRKVDVEHNGDAEDLYLTQVALTFGGDSEAANKVAQKIQGLDYGYLAIPIVRMWLDNDRKTDTATRGWSPAHPVR